MTMFTRLMVSAVMCVSLMAIGPPNAQALNIFGGGLSINSPLLCNSFGTGAGNLFKNPAQVVCTLTNTFWAASCLNPAGQPGGLGNPFSDPFSPGGNDPLDEDNLAGKGKWVSGIVIDVSGVIIPQEACDTNPQWSVDPTVDPVLISANVNIEGFKCAEDDGTGTCLVFEPEPDDVLNLACTLNAARDGYICLEMN